MDDKITALDPVDAKDAERISSLYRELYIHKYTALNPAFTPSFIEMASAAGVLRFRGARDVNRKLSAVAGAYDDGRTMCPQLIAYDQSRPQSEGLYRTAMAISVQMACDAGLKLNWSAGAGTFKATRGGRAVVEYTAFYDRHLSRGRRTALAALDRAVRSFIVPFVQSKGL